MNIIAPRRKKCGILRKCIFNTYISKCFLRNRMCFYHVQAKLQHDRIIRRSRKINHIRRFYVILFFFIRDTGRLVSWRRFLYSILLSEYPSSNYARCLSCPARKLCNLIQTCEESRQSTPTRERVFHQHIQWSISRARKTERSHGERRGREDEAPTPRYRCIDRTQRP